MVYNRILARKEWKLINIFQIAKFLDLFGYDIVKTLRKKWEEEVKLKENGINISFSVVEEALRDPDNPTSMNGLIVVARTIPNRFAKLTSEFQEIIENTRRKWLDEYFNLKSDEDIKKIIVDDKKLKKHILHFIYKVAVNREFFDNYLDVILGAPLIYNFEQIKERIKNKQNLISVGRVKKIIDEYLNEGIIYIDEKGYVYLTEKGIKKYEAEYVEVS